MTYWTQYWTPDQLEVQRAIASGRTESIGHTAGEQFAGVRPGDSVYVLSRESTALLLIGRLDVSEALEAREARQRLGDRVYDASVHLVGGGTAMRLDRTVPLETARKLERETGKPLLNPDTGAAEGMRLLRVGPLATDSAGLLDELLISDVIEIPPGAFEEGRRRTSRHEVLERNASVRSAAIRIHGTSCSVCRFDFGQTYGQLGEGFVEVHHLVPLSARGRVLTDPTGDLTVLCANCHRMVHKHGEPPLSPDALRVLLNEH